MAATSFTSRSDLKLESTAIVAVAGTYAIPTYIDSVIANIDGITFTLPEGASDGKSFTIYFGVATSIDIETSGTDVFGSGLASPETIAATEGGFTVSGVRVQSYTTGGQTTWTLTRLTAVVPVA